MTYTPISWRLSDTGSYGFNTFTHFGKEMFSFYNWEIILNVHVNNFSTFLRSVLLRGINLFRLASQTRHSYRVLYALILNGHTFIAHFGTYFCFSVKELSLVNGLLSSQSFVCSVSTPFTRFLLLLILRKCHARFRQDFSTYPLVSVPKLPMFP